MTIAATQTFPGPAWDELPDVRVLESWPPQEQLPGVDVLLEAVVPVGPDELRLLPDLRLVGNYGVGYDNVDVAACVERGIAVTNTPGVLDAAVAELTLALMLACRRQLVASDRFVRDARWRTGWSRPERLGHDLAGATLGLVGMGRIGSEVGRRAKAFGMQVVHHRRSDGLSLDELLRTSDVVSLHAPLTPETQGLLSRERLALLRDGATLVNTARGAIVDESALVDELVSGRISAGLDVFADEPRVPERLLDLPNVVLTPHIAGSVGDECRRMGRFMVDELKRYLAGEKLQGLVTRDLAERSSHRPVTVTVHAKSPKRVPKVAL